MFIAPVNPIDHNVKLLRDTKCTKCLYANEFEPSIKRLQSELHHLDATELLPWEHYAKAYNEKYPFHKTSESSAWDPIVVLHSSGSTGVPHPVVLRNGYFAAHDGPSPVVPGRETLGAECFHRMGGDRRIYSPTPAYHLSGFNNMCFFPVFTGCINVLTPSGIARPDASLVKTILDAQNVKLLATAPAHIEGISGLRGGIASLSKLDYLCYVGGPLAPAVGDLLKDKVSIIPFYGSTEAGGARLLVPKPDDFQYLEFHPVVQPRFEPIVDGASELIWTNLSSHERMMAFQWTLPEHVLALPSIKETEDRQKDFRSKDLFLPHPDPQRKNLWKFYGRTDDTLVLGNGGKLNPVSAEMAITGNPNISGALVVGQGKYPAALLVEPNEAAKDSAQFVNEIWPTVVKANDETVDWGRINKEMVAVVEPSSFIRAPKGTVVRRLTAEKFNEVIESLYSSPNGTS